MALGSIHTQTSDLTSDGIASAAYRWCETDKRFEGVHVQDLLAVLRDAMKGATSLTVSDVIKGDVMFGRWIPFGVGDAGENRDLDIEDLIERAKSRRRK